MKEGRGEREKDKKRMEEQYMESGEREGEVLRRNKGEDEKSRTRGLMRQENDMFLLREYIVSEFIFIFNICNET